MTGLTTEQKEDLCRRIKCEGHDPSIKNKLKQVKFGSSLRRRIRAVFDAL